MAEILFYLYIVNIFLNRFLNHVLYSNGIIKKYPLYWFIPLLALIILIYGYFLKDIIDWFNGKHWE